MSKEKHDEARRLLSEGTPEEALEAWNYLKSLPRAPHKLREARLEEALYSLLECSDEGEIDPNEQ